MKSLKELLAELWEHPFTGPDQHADHQAMKEHYHAKLLNLGEKKSVLSYMQGSKAMNHRLIDEHVHGPDHPLIATYRKVHPAMASKWDDDYLEKYHGESMRRDFKEADEVRQGLDKIMKKPKIKTPHDMHVYTGVSFNPEHLKDNSGLLHLPAFTSTSIDPMVAKNFAMYHSKAKDDHMHLLKIHVPKGSAGLYVHSDTTNRIHHISFAEKELLLNRNTKMQVHHEPDLDTYGNLDKKIKIWHARLLHDGIGPTRHMT
jgi:hypothetical protein